MIHVNVGRNRDKGPVYRCYVGDGGPVVYEGRDLALILAEARGVAQERGGDTIRVHPGKIEDLEIAGALVQDFTADDLPSTWPSVSPDSPAVPPAPALVAGPDTDQTGPSAMGPREDLENVPGTIDKQDVSGVTEEVLPSTHDDATPTQPVAESTPLQPKRRKQAVEPGQ